MPRRSRWAAIAQGFDWLKIRIPGRPSMSMPGTATVFRLFGSSHLAALLVIVLVATGLVVLARSSRAPRLRRGCEHALALILCALTFGRLIAQPFRDGPFDLQGALPLHYCDLAAMTGAFALWTHRQRLCEIAYFFGLSGTLQALVTPALQTDFPALRYWTFFGSHGAVVITSVYVVLGLRRPPRRGAVARAMLVMSAYALGVGTLDAIMHTNYGFLCSKPPTASLMDWLGPWPWYIGSLWLVGLAFYLLLDFPFWIRRWRMA